MIVFSSHRHPSIQPFVHSSSATSTVVVVVVVILDDDDYDGTIIKLIIPHFTQPQEHNEMSTTDNRSRSRRRRHITKAHSGRKRTEAPADTEAIAIVAVVAGGRMND